MTYRDPSLALQDAVYLSINDLAAGGAFYRVPDNAQLPYIYFGNDDTVADLAAGDFADVTVSVEVYALDKVSLKQIVANVIARLTVCLPLDGFDVITANFSSSSYRTMNDGLTEQASLEFDFLIQPTN